MYKWAEIVFLVFTAGIILFFIYSFAIETVNDNKREKLWKKAMKLIKEYKIIEWPGGNDRRRLMLDIANTWKEYKKLWEKNMWKSISEPKVKEIEKYLVSEKII